MNSIDAKEAVFEVRLQEACQLYGAQHLPSFDTCRPQKSHARSGWNPAPEVSGALRSLYDPNGHWQEIVTGHCRALTCLTQGRTEEAYVNVESIVLPFTKANPSWPA